MSGSSNVTVKNIRFLNHYIHTDPNDLSAAGNFGAVYANGIGGTNIFENLVFSNACWCLTLLGQNTPFLLVSNCAFYNYDHGIVPNGFVDCIIENCWFDTTANWDTYANNYHHDPIHRFSWWTVNSFIIRNNVFTGNMGGNNTAMIYTEFGPAGGVQIYNNLFIQYPGNYLANGMVCLTAGLVSSVYNNTFIGSGVYNSTGLGTDTNCVIANNIFTGLDVFINWQPGVRFASNNIYANEAPGGNLWGPFSGWTNYYNESGSIFTSASSGVVNADGTIPSGSPAIGAGANLSSILTTDYAGNPRPAVGAWAVGAYQGGAVQQSPIISVTPANQDFGMVPVGATTNQTITVQNTGGGTLLGSASAAAPFSIVSGGSYSLTTGQIQPVTISYSPMSVGTNAQTVTFSGGAGVVAPLTGTAVAPPTVISPPLNLQTLPSGQ